MQAGGGKRQEGARWGALPGALDHRARGADLALAVPTFGALPEVPVSDHLASVRWSRATPDFQYDTYDRAHTWRSGTGVEVPASAAVEFKGDPTRMNPEEGLVAALSSCHMLTFLAIAARKGLVVDRYEDDAVGVLEKEGGKLWVTRVTLRPRVVFGGAAPDAAALAHLHEQAHNNCFIANSVKTQVTVEPAG